jgi:hypothetical protein
MASRTSQRLPGAFVHPLLGAFVHPLSGAFVHPRWRHQARYSASRRDSPVVVHSEPRVLRQQSLVHVLLLLLLLLLLCTVLLPVLLPELPFMAQGGAFHGMCPPAPHQAPAPSPAALVLQAPPARHTSHPPAVREPKARVRVFCIFE